MSVLKVPLLLENYSKYFDGFSCLLSGERWLPFGLLVFFFPLNFGIELEKFTEYPLHTVYPVTPNAGMFYQRGYKHLRREYTQGK